MRVEDLTKCEGQWWDAVTDRAREELEKEGNPFSKMMLIGVSSVDRLSDCYVYYGLWASESKIKEMIAEYKGRIYEYYEFKEEVINKIEECEEIQRFLEAAEGYPVDVDLETQGFYRCNDAGTLPGECADFIFHKCND